MRKSVKFFKKIYPEIKILGKENVFITDIVQNSKQVTQNSLFVCVTGLHVDGHQYIKEAVAKGAVAILSDKNEKELEPFLSLGLTILSVKNLDDALKKIVPAFFDYPSQSMRMIGVTGTNGKTTTTYFIKAILEKAGYRVGLIGTIQNQIAQKNFPAQNTTPNIVDLQRFLAKMVEENVSHVVMEVSSHALALDRVAGCEFDTAVFTNLTQDHLDFHKTMENYCQAKELLFKSLLHGVKPKKTAVINLDDPSGKNMLACVKDFDLCDVITYGMHQENLMLKGLDANIHSTGMSFAVQGQFGRINIQLPMTGDFNIYNALAAIGATMNEDKVSMQLIAETLKNFPGVSGRFELVDCGQPFAVIVDYAHTPDGLENILLTAKKFTRGRIITVFGCGGDRDRTKRPIMGRLAAELSDVVLLTSDNPRTEDPEKILDDVAVGVLEKIGNKPYEKIADRHEAIFVAIAMAKPDDTVIIAGKGHENYQILGTEKIHFDDKEVAREALGGIV